MLKLIPIAAALVALPVIAYGGSTLMTATPTADSGTSGAQAKKGPIACEIKVTKKAGGMTMLEGVVTGEQAMKGSYRMRVTQKSDGGSSDIDQSGDFDVTPGKMTKLNEMSVSNAGMQYEAELTITWPGGKLSCKDASETAL